MYFDSRKRTDRIYGEIEDALIRAKNRDIDDVLDKRGESVNLEGAAEKVDEIVQFYDQVIETLAAVMYGESD